MGCADCCAKTIIIIINILFFLIGIAFLAAGVVFFVAKDLFAKWLVTLFEGVLEAVNVMLMRDVAAADEAAEVALILDIFSPLAIALIVIGIVMIISTILAMCGSCCSVNCMLITYVVIVLVIFATHLALFISLMVGGFRTPIKDSLQKSIDNQYGGRNASDAYSLGWNIFMSQYECCGIDGYSDFNSSTSWNRFPDKERTEPLKTPVACCIREQRDISEDYDCAYNPTDATSNWKSGCWQRAIVDDTRNPVIGVSCGILGFELILAALTLCVIFQAKRKE